MRKGATLTSGLLLLSLTVGTGVGVEVVSQGTAAAAIAITVNDASDGAPVPGNCTMVVEGDCTLRAAIEAANASAGDATITLPDANTVANNPNPSHIYQIIDPNGQLDFNDSGHTITVNGAGGTLAILQLQNEGPITNRVMTVEAGTTADISGITAEDGNVSSSGGGGILNDGTLNLSNSTVTNNTASFGGGVELFSGAATLTNDAIDENEAVNDAGGIYVQHGITAISGGSISDNTSGSDTGGLYLQNDGAGDTTTVTGTTIDDNTSGADTGGVYVQNDGVGTTVAFTNVAIDSNTAASDTGGLYLQNDGTGDTFTFNGGSVSSNTATSSDAGGIYDQNDGTDTTVSVTNVAVNENSANTTAGGVYVQNDGSQSTTTFSGGSIDGNDLPAVDGADGGGVYVQNDGDPSSLSMSGGSISGNFAYQGGGVFLGVGTAGETSNSFTQETIDSNHASEAGAGFDFETSQGGDTTISASTIAQNVVGGVVGNTLLGKGGGILSASCNAIALVNDTITGNIATFGGGYYGVNCAESPAVSTGFTFDTVSGNTASDTSSARNIETVDDSTLTFGDTIIANGSASGGPATNCLFTGPGSVSSQGYNLIDNTNCGTAAATDIIGKNPQLGALGNNGGPTQTELPGSTSPAVGAIPAAACGATAINQDQRGVARGAGVNGSCTIGAVEVGQAFNPNGYRLVADEGGIFDFGLNFNGSLANNKLNAPIVGLANSPGPNGYLMVGGDGGVFAEGGANFYGSLGGGPIPSPIAAIAAPPSETGYWLAAQNGKIYPFGSVPSLPAVQLPPGAHLVGMASTTDGQGAWLTDQFGDVYAEGTAQYKGGLGGVHINAPIVGLAAAANGQGYVLAATDGGAFNYGTQGFFGSVPGSLQPGQSLVAPVVGIAVTHSGAGYWEVGADGGVFNYGDAPFLGSIYTAIPGQTLNGPIVGIQHLGSAPA